MERPTITVRLQGVVAFRVAAWLLARARFLPGRWRGALYNCVVRPLLRVKAGNAPATPFLPTWGVR